MGGVQKALQENAKTLKYSFASHLILLQTQRFYERMQKHSNIVFPPNSYYCSHKCFACEFLWEMLKTCERISIGKISICLRDRPPPTLCFNLKTLHIAGCPGSHRETVRHAPATSNPQRSENFRVPERIYHGVNDGVTDGRKSRSVGVDHR